MRPKLVLLLALSSVLGACLGGTMTDGEDNEGDGASGTGAGATNGPADLPCDVAAVLSTCTSCHATTSPSGGLRIASAADLTAPSPADPSVTVAERSLARMKDGTMPPGAPLGADQLAIFEAWIADGMPTGDCSGAGGAPPIEVVCTSNSFWTMGDEGDEDMHPGMACISCHQEPNDEGETGPDLLFAGTVYPTLHEPDDCEGAGDAVVVVTDATGRVVQANVRASGNFFAEEGAPLALPIRAEVRRGDKVLAMQDPVDSVDCNSCHTTMGAENAPGRIIAP